MAEPESNRVSLAHLTFRIFDLHLRGALINLTEKIKFHNLH